MGLNVIKAATCVRERARTRFDEVIRSGSTRPGRLIEPLEGPPRKCPEMRKSSAQQAPRPRSGRREGREKERKRSGIIILLQIYFFCNAFKSTTRIHSPPRLLACVHLSRRELLPAFARSSPSRSLLLPLVPSFSLPSSRLSLFPRSLPFAVLFRFALPPSSPPLSPSRLRTGTTANSLA